MKAFVIHVNGKKLCTIGIGDGVLTAMVMRSSSSQHISGNIQEFFLQVGGLDAATNEHVDWNVPTELSLGDEITIKIVDAQAVDPEHNRYKAKP